MKIKLVKRKFYNKWKYKISFNIKGSSFSRWIRADYRDRIDPFYFNLSDKLLSFEQSSYFKRVEKDTTDIYLNDLSIFNEMCNEYSAHIRQIFSVNPEVENFSDGDHVIVSKKYPHDRYKFKVYLQPHKIKDKKEKIDFIDWLDSQSFRVSISNTVKKWFIDTTWNWDRRYMYVEDEQTLLMLKLRKNEAVGTVYNYVLSDK